MDALLYVKGTRPCSGANFVLCRVRWKRRCPQMDGVAKSVGSGGGSECHVWCARLWEGGKNCGMQTGVATPANKCAHSLQPKNPQSPHIAHKEHANAVHAWNRGLVS